MTGSKILDKYNTIIWDWNGTLLNDVWLCVEIVNEILVNHTGKQLDEGQYKEVFGFPIVEYYRRIGIDFGKESFELLTEKFISTYDSKVRASKLHNGVDVVLSKFKDNRMNQYILTAAHKESVFQLLRHYSILQIFDEIEGLDNHRAESKVERGKVLVERNQIDRSRAVLIGDTIHDFEVANQIGVDCILISNGHQSKERLKRGTLNQVMVLNEINELI